MVEALLGASVPGGTLGAFREYATLRLLHKAIMHNWKASEIVVKISQHKMLNTAPCNTIARRGVQQSVRGSQELLGSPLQQGAHPDRKDDGLPHGVRR